LALVRGQHELAAAPVGEDHAEPPATGRDGGAGDGGDAGEPRVARRQLALELVRGLDHGVVRQGALRDRGLVEGAPHVGAQARALPGPLATHPDLYSGFSGTLIRYT